MALNFQQLFERLREIGRDARAQHEDLQNLQARAVEAFSHWADQAARLNEKLERARHFDPNLRCAIPLTEPLNAAHDPPLELPNFTLIAADGSQILPDRHAQELYSLVNVGAIVMQAGSGEAPEVFTDSSLYYGKELYTETGMRTAESIEGERDIAERRKLVELAERFPGQVIAMTDGPVELWSAAGGEENEYRRNLEAHKSSLAQLQSRGATLAGYVDKPAADLVVRLLELACLSTEEQFKDVRTQHPFRGVTDLWLFCRCLAPGQRSAVFGMQSRSCAHYTGALAIHFFYLNVGEAGHPWLARLEIPGWVAEDEGKLDMLQAALLEQCRILGARPYPYILHRAHEIAVVKNEDKKQVEQMLVLELRKQGVAVGEQSNKQSVKDLPGKGRNRK